ncbi:C-type lectin domain family 4 member E-like isoform X1 [Acropora muricata]|uniref:C-type lectin domain family 4 member E-like isoform X1 n=1 Tax=Acropora muricata TaxID=159855 RepID=UPI0034E5A83A
METFNLLVIFKQLIFLILLSFAHADEETSVDETTAAISRKAIPQKFEFVNFKQDKFSFLNITALVKRAVEDSLSCTFSCLDNLACFSFNVAAFPDKAGKFTCEILSSDKYNNSEGFLPSNTFHHFSIVSPCSNLPCKDNGKCVTIYETNRYVCVCKKQFTGKHCEIEICPAGFVVHGESCYYVASTSSASTWNNSRRFCQDLGADLAVIKSEDENKFVYDLLRNTSRAHDGWIGLYRKKNDKKFYWLDGRTAEGNFQKWNDGEPSNEATEDFGRILGDSNEEKKKGNWNDTPRSSTMPLAICQWPI